MKFCGYSIKEIFCMAAISAIIYRVLKYINDKYIDKQENFESSALWEVAKIMIGMLVALGVIFGILYFIQRRDSALQPVTASDLA